MRVGIDVGGTKAAAVLVDDAGTVLASAHRATRRGPGPVVETILEVIRDLGPLPGGWRLGVGVPGHVDSGTGFVANAVNLGVGELALGDRLEASLGVPVRVDNDVKAAAVGARLAVGGRSLAYLNLGTGLAVGVVADGLVWRGHCGVAGEIGHLPVDPADLPCPCGQRGCLETIASGSAVARRWPSDHPVPPRALFAAAAAGDAAAAAVRRDLLDGVARAVLVCALTWDVERIVLGGGLSRLGPELLLPVRAALESRVAGSPFLRGLGLPARVVGLPDGFPAAAIGAALISADAASNRDQQIGAIVGI